MHGFTPFQLLLELVPLLSDEAIVIGKLVEFLVPLSEQVILFFELFDELGDFAILVVTFHGSELCNLLLKLLASFFIKVRNPSKALIDPTLVDALRLPWRQDIIAGSRSGEAKSLAQCGHELVLGLLLLLGSGPVTAHLGLRSVYTCSSSGSGARYLKLICFEWHLGILDQL